MTYGPPTANEHLRASIHGSISYQERLNQAPLFCPEGIESENVIERWPWPKSALVIAAVCIGAWALGWLAVANAAEQPRVWIVWDIDADRPWVSAKGYRATATGPTACNLNLHEASKASPSGSRLSCRRIDQQRN